MDRVKVSWSGGKDSTCASLLHLDRGHEVVQVCYIPFLTDEIPLIRKCHYDFILSSADRFRSLGSDVRIVTGETFQHYCLRPASKGIRKGLPLGFPLFWRGACGFKRDSKLKALNSISVTFDYEDIGIAFDEYSRHNQLNEFKRSILVELGYTEAQALAYCFDRGFLSPLYSSFSWRDGCGICGNASISEFLSYIDDYPLAADILLDLESRLRPLYPTHAPYRNYEWYSDRLRVPPLFSFDISKK